MKLLINYNDYSFSARPEESIILYDEFILDDEIKAINNRISKSISTLRKLQAPVKNEPIKEKNEIYYFDYHKQASKSFANYFLDIQVNF